MGFVWPKLMIMNKEVQMTVLSNFLVIHWTATAYNAYLAANVHSYFIIAS